MAKEQLLLEVGDDVVCVDAANAAGITEGVVYHVYEAIHRGSVVQLSEVPGKYYASTRFELLEES